MSTLIDRLTAALGLDAVSEATGRAEADICRHDIGLPLAYVRPANTEGVAAVVRLAREVGARVVPVGRRTGYWHPLDLTGAIALETSQLRGVLDHDVEAGWVRVGAGMQVRALDNWLRQRGAILAVHPDAFGDTAIGAAVAMDLAAGIGMGRAVARDIVLGLRVVSGAGQVIATGAALSMGQAPFTRAGLPDPTELFCASEGALGVITEVVVRIWPRPALGKLSWRSDGADVSALVEFAGTLRRPGLIDTYRVDRTVSRDVPTPQWSHTLVLESAFDVDELVRRIVNVEANIRRSFDDPDVDVVIDDAEGAPRFDRWLGPPGAHAGIKKRAHFAGVDVLVPWGTVAAACDVADQVLADASELTFIELRHALYFSWRSVNLGLHMNFAAPEGARAEGVDELVAGAQDRFSALDIAPYRWGRQWGRVMGARLDPGYRELMTAIKQTLDPDAVLHPGVSIFSPDL